MESSQKSQIPNHVCKVIARGKKLLIKVILHRIPEKFIHYIIYPDRFHLDTLQYTKKYVLDLPYPEGVTVTSDEKDVEGVLEYGILKFKLDIETKSKIEKNENSLNNKKEIRQSNIKKRKSLDFFSLQEMFQHEKEMKKKKCKGFEDIDIPEDFNPRFGDFFDLPVSHTKSKNTNISKPISKMQNTKEDTRTKKKSSFMENTPLLKDIALNIANDMEKQQKEQLQKDLNHMQAIDMQEQIRKDKKKQKKQKIQDKTQEYLKNIRNPQKIKNKLDENGDKSLDKETNVQDFKKSKKINKSKNKKVSFKI